MNKIIFADDEQEVINHWTIRLLLCGNGNFLALQVNANRIILLEEMRFVDNRAAAGRRLCTTLLSNGRAARA